MISYKPDISIVVPVYNCQDTINRCIKSLVNQTLKNIEIIIVDDGSTDDSSSIVDELSMKDNRIVVIHKENSGVSATRNLGIKHAKGEFIGFVDADDFVDTTMYEKLYNLVKKEASEMALCSFYVDAGTNLYEKEEEWHEYIDKDNVKESIFLNMIAMNNEESFNNRGTIMGSTCRCIYKNNALNINNILFDEKITYAEDLLFNLKFLDKIKKISLIDEYLYYYKKKRGSLSLIYREDFYNSIKNLISEIKSISINHCIGDRISYLWFGYMIEVLRNSTRQIHFIDLKKLGQIRNIVKDRDNKKRLINVNFKRLNTKNKFFYLMFYNNSMTLGVLFYIFKIIKWNKGFV
jgi:glycosyltransferase involved in cell wall biosynthesis